MADKNYNTDSVFAFTKIPANDDEGKGALGATFNEWYTNHVRSLWPKAIQSFENVAFLLGNHYARFLYDTTANSFGISIVGSTGTAPGPDTGAGLDDVPKVVDNRLPRATEAMAGLLTENDLQPRVEPNSEAMEDEDAADLAEITLNLVFDRPMDLSTKLREAATTAAIFEYVVAETEYAETGEVIEVPEIEIRQEPDDSGFAEEGATVPTAVVTGSRLDSRKDERVRIWTNLHVIPDPAATSPDNAIWFARTTFEDIDWIREKYEQNKDRKESDGYLLEPGGTIASIDATHHPLYWYTRVQDLLVTPHDTYGAGLTASNLRAAGGLPNQTTFTVVDVRPSMEFPRGRTLIWAGETLIYHGDARAWSEKYPWRWHPYNFFSWFNVPGRFGGMPMLTELVPLQKRINAIDYLVQRNREYMAIGQWWLPKHSKVKLGSVSGMPGNQYEYTDIQGLSKPERVRNDPLPGDLYEERRQLVSAIEYISSTGSTADDVSASAARAGVMMDFFRAEKLRNKSPMLKSWERFIEGIGQNALIDLQLHLTDEDDSLSARVRAAAREYSDLSIETFTGASLRDHHSVKIDVASAARHTPEALQQLAMEYVQYRQGNISPAENQAVLKAIGLDRFVKNESDASLKRARRMISRIEAGMIEAFLPMPQIDDPTVMMPEFQRAILADRFLTHPQEVQAKLIEGFYYYHGAVQSMMQAMMGPGGPPLPPSAGPPQAPPPTEG